MKRAELAIKIILTKPQGGLNLVREMRHEIIMDILRVEDRFSKRLIELTNGSPSFTVVLGIVAAAVLLSIALTLVHFVPGLNIFKHMDSYFVDAEGKPALIRGSIEAAAIAAFIGGVVSVFTRLAQFETRRGVDPKLLFMNALARPYIGTAMAMFIVAVQGFGLFSIATAKPDAQNFAFFLIVIDSFRDLASGSLQTLLGVSKGDLGVGVQTAAPLGVHRCLSTSTKRSSRTGGRAATRSISSPH